MTRWRLKLQLAVALGVDARDVNGGGGITRRLVAQEEANVRIHVPNRIEQGGQPGLLGPEVGSEHV